MKKTCFIFALKYEETFFQIQYYKNEIPIANKYFLILRLQSEFFKYKAKFHSQISPKNKHFCM